MDPVGAGGGCWLTDAVLGGGAAATVGTPPKFAGGLEGIELSGIHVGNPGNPIPENPYFTWFSNKMCFSATLLTKMAFCGKYLKSF